MEKTIMSERILTILIASGNAEMKFYRNPRITVL